MTMSNEERLRLLGRGESIEKICQTDGISRPEFDSWWQEQIQQRAVPSEGKIAAGVTGEVSIRRDANGIPHIFAESDRDLFFGFGFAMAEDRLFQLDWLKRLSLIHI